jgi:hypothetical protein
MQEPNKRDILGKRARTEAWKKFRNAWVVEYTSEDPEVNVVGNSKIPDSIELLGNLDNASTRAKIMMRYDPNRRCIRDEANNPTHTLRTSPAFRAMIQLSRRDYSHPAVFYPGEEPSRRGGALECRHCRLILDELVCMSLKIRASLTISC